MNNMPFMNEIEIGAGTMYPDKRIIFYPVPEPVSYEAMVDNKYMQYESMLMAEYEYVRTEIKHVYKFRGLTK